VTAGDPRRFNEGSGERTGRPGERKRAVTVVSYSTLHYTVTNAKAAALAATATAAACSLQAQRRVKTGSQTVSTLSLISSSRS